jgi:hypothetical protein
MPIKADVRFFPALLEMLILRVWKRGLGAYMMGRGKQFLEG